jgi:hypothetical protein
VKTARTLVFPVIGSVHDARFPRHAPVQALSFQPFAGVALSRSGAYDVTGAAHRPGQAIPKLELRIAPLPETRTRNRYVVGAKSALGVALWPTVTEHSAAPPHAPLQRTSFAPGFGTGASTSLVSAFHVVVQLWAQERPGTSDSTRPGPEMVSESGVWRSSCTSHGESRRSSHEPEWP